MKIRIAVAVSSEGAWNCGGYGDANGPAAESDAWVTDGLPDDAGLFHIVYVEADVPLPSGQVVVEGKVVE